MCEVTTRMHWANVHLVTFSAKEYTLTLKRTAVKGIRSPYQTNFMKISEIIGQLQRVMTDHGDLDALVGDKNKCTSDEPLGSEPTITVELSPMEKRYVVFRAVANTPILRSG